MSGKILKTLIAIFVVFLSYNVEAVSPAQPILPSDNIQDPGALSTPWGGCTPADANCYVTTSGSTFSETVDGLEYATSTGILSLTSGYIIPTSVSVDAWNTLVTDSSNFVRQGGNTLGTTLTLGTNDANNLSFVTDSAERLTITAGGSIGINNVNPNYTLDVNGDVNVSGFLYGQGGGWYIDTSGNFSGNANYANSAGYVAASVDSNFNGFNVSNVGTLSATSLSLTNGLSVASGGTGASSFTAGRILFGNGSSAINSSASLFWDNANGRLGIGTTTPATTLAVTSGTNLGTMTFENGSVGGGGSPSLSLGVGPSSGATAGAYMQLTGRLEAWSTLIATTNATGFRTMRFGNSTNGVIDTTNGTFSIQRLNDAGNAITATPFQMSNAAPSASFIINSTGNIGIGTTTPGSKLHVFNSVNSELVNFIENPNSGSSAYTGLRIKSDNAASTYMFLNSTTRSTDGGVNTFTIRNDAGALRLQGQSATGGISISGQNVGINVTSPSTALHIVKSDASAALVRLQNSNATGYSAFEMYNSSSTFASAVGYANASASIFPGALYINGASTVPIVFGINNIEQARLHTNGNFGIGTTTPASKLVVNGTQASGDLQIGVSLNNTASNGYSVFRIGTATASPVGMGLHQFNSAYSGGGTYTPLTTTLTAFESGGLVLHANSASAPIKFFTGGSADVNERMRILSSGNVGIGTTTPTEKLSIAAGSDATSLRVSGTNTGTNWAGRIIAGGATSVFLMGQFNNQAWLGAHNAALNAWADFYINPDGGTKTFIGDFGGGTGTVIPLITADNTSGNVGIGTTTPTEKLSIVGGVNLTGALKLSGNAGTSGMVLQTTGTGLQWTATSSLGISSDITSLAVISGGRSNTVTGSNAVAFGLSNYNPASNGVAFGISNTIGTSSGYSTVIGTANTAGSIGYSTVIGRANTANSQQSTVVGIGNSAPTDYSTAIGSTNLIYGAGVAHLAFGDSNTINPGGASRAAAIGHSNTVNVGGAYVFGNSITNSTSNSVMIGPSDSAKITILSSGNLGVGTTTPGVRLSVVGNAQFTAVGSGAYGFDLNLTSNGTLTTSASDERLKQNVMAINSSSTLDKINQLKPSTFDWKSDGSHDLGLIAQEVQGIFPELVFTNPSDGYLGINYSRFTPLLISAIQELSRKVDAVLAWFKDGTFNVQSDVCVDDVCVTKDQFKNMLRNAGGQQQIFAPTYVPPTEPVVETPIAPTEGSGTSTEEAVTPPTPDETPVPVVVEPAPEPTPVVETPAPEAAPVTE